MWVIFAYRLAKARKFKIHRQEFVENDGGKFVPMSCVATDTKHQRSLTDSSNTPLPPGVRYSQTRQSRSGSCKIQGRGRDRNDSEDREKDEGQSFNRHKHRVPGGAGRYL